MSIRQPSGRSTFRQRALLALPIVLSLVLSLAFWTRGYAATITVTTPSDDVDPSNGSCSLREAVDAFSSNSAFDACPAPDGVDDTIILPAGTYTFESGLGAMLVNRAASLSIVGAGAGQTIIDAAGAASGAFSISAGATVTISGVTIRNASAAGGAGGAISVNGATLTLRSSVVENSEAAFGAGIYVIDGTLAIDSSTISGNTAATRGGGVFSNNSTTTIVNSTIYNNQVTGSAGTGPFDGGGIRRFGGGTLTINNSTISGNSAAGNGGGIANSTSTPATDVSFSNTLIAGNTDGDSSAPDCVGDLSSAGYNLVGNAEGCTVALATGDLIGSAATPIDPLLGPLQDNGGPTPVLALAAGSPARNAGNPAAPGSAPACEATDQRGIARPQSTGCDIGAFERVDTPAISTLTPDSVIFGSGAFELTVQGSGFVAGQSTVRWGGADRTTTFVSAGELRASILAADVATAGSIDVTVNTNLPDGGVSNSVSFAVSNPAPTLTSLSPDRVPQGSDAFTLTITGTNFVASSVVRWNGADRVTTFVSPTELEAAIPASDLITAGSAQVVVFNRAPGGGTTDPISVTVFGPPVISSEPQSETITAGSSVTLTVTATGEGLTYQWYEGSSGDTGSPIAGADTASLVVTPTTTTEYWVRVTNAAGSTDSTTATVTISDQPNPLPTISALNPSQVQAGGPAFTLVVTGNNFVNGATVRWNGQDRPTTRVSSTRLSISVGAADIATPGIVRINVYNPGPGGGLSAPRDLTITPRDTFTVSLPLVFR